MRKEQANINNLYVCYCLLKRGRYDRGDNEKLWQMSEILYQAQEYYEQKGAVTYQQAFVYGNGEAASRSFAKYMDGFRAALDENVEPYSIRDALLLSYAHLQGCFKSSERNSSGNGIENMYRLVIIADYPLYTDSRSVHALADRLNSLKRERDNFKICYMDVHGEDNAGNLHMILDGYNELL